MDFLEHTTDWYKGEIFESTIIGVFGIVFLIGSVLFWKFGTTPNAKAMILPILVVGLLLSITGTLIRSENTKKINELIKNQPKNLTEFIKSEKKRVDDFQVLYTYTKIGAGLVFALAIGVFFLSKNRHLQSIVIALIILGVAGLIIDYFSKERADIYYEQILNTLK